MAKYKNREVVIVQEIPHTQGDQVLIEHLELMGQREIVPMNQIVLTKDEKKAKEDERAKRAKEAGVDQNDYRVEGETDQVNAILPTAKEVVVQRQAEDNLKRNEEQKKEADAWTKNHPDAPANAKRELDAIKVVPYRDEKPVDPKAPVKVVK